MNWKEREAGLRCLTVLAPYGEVEGLALLTQLAAALAREDGADGLAAYIGLYRLLARGGHRSLKEYLAAVLREEETLCGQMAQGSELHREVEEAAKREYALLDELARLEGGQWKAALVGLLPSSYGERVAALPSWWGEGLEPFHKLMQWWEKEGCGLFACNRAFLWSRGRLIPIPDPDVPKPEEMMGYESQRAEVVENTRALMAGKGVNNALLFGDGGTGKSATVKSLLGVPGLEALRLIEVEKEGLRDLPLLIRQLGSRKQKFVLFLDDLTFDRDDSTYSALKTVLEGGLERRPDNVAIYATSNRRNLVRQTFSDRDGDEVDAAETVAEKTSLAERFGLRVAYLTLNQAEYLATVERMAALYGIEMDGAELRRRALQWERYHHGRTPRTARQFIADL